MALQDVRLPSPLKSPTPWMVLMLLGHRSPLRPPVPHPGLSSYSHSISWARFRYDIEVCPAFASPFPWGRILGRQGRDDYASAKRARGRSADHAQ